MTARFLAVKNFRRFQHYKDRNPPWIKLYTDVLVDPAFLQLPEVAQAQLLKLWVLRAQFGPLPNNTKLLAGKIGAAGKFHLPALIGAGFIVPADDPAPIENPDEVASTLDSTPLAPREQTASNGASKTLADSGQNAIPSVRADARSRESESESSEVETELPPPSGDQSRIAFCGAANKGLSEHPTRAQPIARVMANAAKSYEATEEILKAGVPHDFAVSAIYEVARSHDADGQITSLKYFIGAVIRRWSQHNASGDARRSKPGALPSNGNGSGKSWQEEVLEEAAARGLK